MNAEILKVAITGLDGCGKSSHITSILSADPIMFHEAPRIWRAPVMDPEAAFWWWFGGASLEEIQGLVIELLNERHAGSLKDVVNLHDRSTNQYIAVIAASHRLRFPDVSIEEASALARSNVGQALSYDPTSEKEIFLVKNPAYDATTESYRSGSGDRIPLPPAAALVYNSYQLDLEASMQILCDSSQRVVVDRSFIEVHNELRNSLTALSGVRLPVFLGNLSQLVGLGGLSESGKSSHGDYLRTTHGFMQLKLAYFVEEFRRNHKNRLPSNWELVLAVFRFIQSHRGCGNFSIESFHGAELPCMLKLMLGKLFQIVYLEAPEEVRIDRHLSLRIAGGDSINRGTATKEVLYKDKLKREGGAHLVAEVACIRWPTTMPQQQSFSGLATRLRLE